jgi:hypothetical protein
VERADAFSRVRRVNFKAALSPLIKNRTRNRASVADAFDLRSAFAVFLQIGYVPDAQAKA